MCVERGMLTNEITYIIMSLFCRFIISYIYYALSWNTNDLGGNPYLTFFICGAVELPATIMFLYISKCTGHRMALLIANVLAGLCLLLVIPVPVGKKIPFQYFLMSLVSLVNYVIHQRTNIAFQY